MTAASSPDDPASTRAFWLAPALAVVVATALTAWAVGPYLVGVFHDDGVYALVARSIATGHGFHYPHLAGAPAATHYPPLYPLLLSVLWLVAPVFPDNVGVLVGLNAPLVGLAAAGWWFFATTRGQWGRWAALAGALASTLALPTLALASALLSESLFLALLWPSLLLSERAAERDERRDIVVAGVAIGVLMLVRTHAVAVLLALLVVLIARRRGRDAALAFGCAIAVQLPWLVWSAAATPRVATPLEGAYGSYLGWFADGLRDGRVPFVLATVRMNAVECWLFVRDRLAAGFAAPIHAATVGIVAGACVTGVGALAKRAPVTVIFLACYMGVVLVWPYNPWRFVWAVWPLIGLVVLTGFRWSWQRAGRWRPVVAVTALLPSAAVLRVELHTYAAREWRAPARAATAQFTPVLHWVHANLPGTDVILSEGEQILALYEGRRAAPPISFTAREYLAPPSPAEGAARLSDMIVAVPARYVILLAPPMLRSAALLANRRPGLRMIQPLSSGAAFEVLR